jgi:GNAT superfamily N-acetyltransferase
VSDADALAEMARNRGLKLVRSRVRTPGKLAYGKYGLTNANGTKLLGLDGKHPSASAEEVEAFLRKGLVADWAGSIGAEGLKVRKRRPVAKSTAPQPPPPPTLLLRDAKPADAKQIVALIGILGHEVDAAGVVKRLSTIRTPQLVVTLGPAVVGLCGLDAQVHIHRTKAVGRITILVVAEATRGQGIGRLLAEEAEARLRRAGCVLIEVTSNDRLTDAHGFYAHLGFEQTSKRFAKAL